MRYAALLSDQQATVAAATDNKSTIEVSRFAPPLRTTLSPQSMQILAI